MHCQKQTASATMDGNELRMRIIIYSKLGFVTLQHTWERIGIMIRQCRAAAAWIAVWLVLMAALAGCGAGQGGTAGEPLPKEKQENAKPNAEQTDTATACGKDSKEQAGKTRKVKDHLGEVEIPVKPQRVAALYLEDYVTALGVKPVVQWYHPNWGKQDYLKLDAPTFDYSGNIEALLSYSPDLIIVDGGADAAKYEMFSKVAPTYRLPDSILQNTPEILKTVADLLGVPEKAEPLLEAYKRKLADAKGKLEKAVGKETVAVLRLNVGEKTINLLGIENMFVGSILYKDLGLTPPMLVKEMKPAIDFISMEKLPELGADHIFILPSNGTWGSDENKEAVKLLDNPIWKSIPAVKNGKVYQVERTYWQTGAYQANLLKIDDVLQSLVK